jgi:hypothetical protein
MKSTCSSLCLLRLASPPLHLTVRLWDATDGESVETVVRNVASFADLQARILQHFPILQEACAAGRLQLYYLKKPSSQDHRCYVDNDIDLRAFAQVELQLDARCQCLIGFVRSQPKGSEGSSPNRLPQHLRIQTHTPPAQDPADGHRLTPPSSSPSPKDEEGRSQRVKTLCIQRDSVDLTHVKCRLCKKKCPITWEGSSPRYGSYGQVAHIVSFKPGDREGMDVPACLLQLARIGAGGSDGVDVLPMCSSCACAAMGCLATGFCGAR